MLLANTWFQSKVLTSLGLYHNLEISAYQTAASQLVCVFRDSRVADHAEQHQRHHLQHQLFRQQARLPTLLRRSEVAPPEVGGMGCATHGKTGLGFGKILSLWKVLDKIT